MTELATRGLASDDLLLRRYAEGEVGARDEMARRYMPLAQRVTARYRGGTQPQEDLEQVAYVALLKAIDRFDPTLGSFTGFAVTSILGELKRYFRDHSWAMRVGRNLQERWQRISLAQEQLTIDLGRSPTPREIAARLDMSIEEVSEGMDAGSAYSLETLDGPIRRDGPSDLVLGDVLGADDAGYATVDFTVTLAPAFARLSQREREVLGLRFREDMTQKEIGRALGVSQMQISRLLRRALAKLHHAAETPVDSPDDAGVAAG